MASPYSPTRVSRGGCPRCSDDVYMFPDGAAHCLDCRTWFGVTSNGTRPTPSPAHGSANAAPGIGPGASLIPAGTRPTLADIAAANALLDAQQAAQARALQNALQNPGTLAGLGQTLGSLVGALGLGVGQLAQPHPLAHLGAETEPPKPLPTAGITVGELVGWRIWQVRPTDRLLESYSAERIWLPGEPMTGEPDDHGGAGVWAFKEAYRAAVKSQECYLRARHGLAMGQCHRARGGLPG
jgi:hypothetical protein